MSTLVRSFGFTALLFASLGLRAGDFGPLMQVARDTWPEKSTIGVICDYSKSSQEVQELAQAAGPGYLIQVVDIQRREQFMQGVQLLQSQKPDYVVLLTRDPLMPDYSIEATQAVRVLAQAGIPTISTSSVALKQGAVFALGERTHGQLQVCKAPIGSIQVTLPGSQPVMAGTMTSGMATIQVASKR